ncbi:MAG: hypothetical protein QM669_02675 [Siphonobacter sp.]
MKTYPFVLLLTGLLFACGSDESKTEATTETVASASKTATLVFLDKSQSVNANQEFVTQKYGRVLSELVKKNMIEPQDKLEVWLIHENTAKGKALELTLKTEMPSTEGMSPTDVEAAQSNYDLSLQRERLNFTNQILAQLKTPNDSKSSEQTDIQASLGAIEESLEKGYTVKAYFFSDMVESMKEAGRRDLHQTLPHSSQQADEWAKADAAKIKSKYPDLTGVSVVMVLPFEPTTSSKVNNPVITDYWKTFFKSLGVASVEETN